MSESLFPFAPRMRHSLNVIQREGRLPSLAAKVRWLYWRHVRGYDFEVCHHCGRPVRLVFWTPDEIWQLATGLARHQDGEAAGGILCPTCVDGLVTPQVDGYLTWTCEVTR